MLLDSPSAWRNHSDPPIPRPPFCAAGLMWRSGLPAAGIMRRVRTSHLIVVFESPAPYGTWRKAGLRARLTDGRLNAALAPPRMERLDGPFTT